MNPHHPGRIVSPPSTGAPILQALQERKVQQSREICIVLRVSVRSGVFSVQTAQLVGSLNILSAGSGILRPAAMRLTRRSSMRDMSACRGMESFSAQYGEFTENLNAPESFNLLITFP